MVKTLICICGKQLRDGEDVRFHLTEKPDHVVDVQQWEFVVVPSNRDGWRNLERWVKVAEWNVSRNKKASMGAPLD